MNHAIYFIQYGICAAVFRLANMKANTQLTKAHRLSVHLHLFHILNKSIETKVKKNWSHAFSVKNHTFLNSNQTRSQRAMRNQYRKVWSILRLFVCKKRLSIQCPRVGCELTGKKFSIRHILTGVFFPFLFNSDYFMRHPFRSSKWLQAGLCYFRPYLIKNTMNKWCFVSDLNVFIFTSDCKNEHQWISSQIDYLSVRKIIMFV